MQDKCRVNADSLAGKTGNILSHNVFAYCVNNPVNMEDPSGQLPFLVVTAIVGAVIGAVAGGIIAAKTGKNVWAGIGIGAAAVGLIGSGVGAVVGLKLAGSAIASYAAVVAGGKAVIAGTAAAGGGAAAAANQLAKNQAIGKVGELTVGIVKLKFDS